MLPMPKFRSSSCFSPSNIPYQLTFTMNKFAELKDLVMSLEGDFEKFYDKKNQAAGTRVRKGMQDLKVMAQNIRSEVQGMKNTDV